VPVEVHEKRKTSEKERQRPVRCNEGIKGTYTGKNNDLAVGLGLEPFE